MPGPATETSGPAVNDAGPAIDYFGPAVSDRGTRIGHSGLIIEPAGRAARGGRGGGRSAPSVPSLATTCTYRMDYRHIGWIIDVSDGSSPSAHTGAERSAPSVTGAVRLRSAPGRADWLLGDISAKDRMRQPWVRGLGCAGSESESEYPSLGCVRVRGSAMAFRSPERSRGAPLQAFPPWRLAGASRRVPARGRPADPRRARRLARRRAAESESRRSRQCQESMRTRAGQDGH
jgi:hypothetical protein